MDNTNSPMWNAFMENQKFTDKEASNIEIAKQQFQHDREKEAIAQLGRSQNISDHMFISGKVTENDINHKTKSHPHFQNYDHSLDSTRARFTEDGADILANGISIPELEPEGLRLCPREMPAIEMDQVNEKNIPDFGIDWDNIGKQLGL